MFLGKVKPRQVMISIKKVTLPILAVWDELCLALSLVVRQWGKSVAKGIIWFHSKLCFSADPHKRKWCPDELIIIEQQVWQYSWAIRYLLFETPEHFEWRENFLLVFVLNNLTKSTFVLDRWRRPIELCQNGMAPKAGTNCLHYWWVDYLVEII